MPFLIEHIKKDWVEAFPGDEVTIIADHGNVQILDKDGVRFSVMTNKLTDKQISTKIEEVIIKQKINWLPPKKQEGTIQTLL